MRKQKATIPTYIRKTVLERDGYKCRYCGSEKTPLHIDHVYPESKGGETSVKNMVTACASCNTKKHSRVGMWPKPIGHFDKPPVILINRNKKAETPFAFVALLAIGAAVASIHVFFDITEPISTISTYSGMVIGASSLLVEFGWRMKK